MNPRILLFIPACILLPVLFFLVSCSKAPQPNDTLKIKQNDPVMSAHNIEVLFSDSGKVQAKLISPLMNRYAGSSPFLEFPKGFKVYMFDSVQQISSTITGTRGLRREYSRTMEAWGNVIVRNEKKNEQINTEHLIWDENKHRIWSDVKVKITRPDQVLYGASMESNESFTQYSIKGPTGEMNVKKDSI
ncbi:MAG: LPS export ABC transporter periplasmic protein LptC [Bacteroidota bacterium]